MNGRMGGVVVRCPDAPKAMYSETGMVESRRWGMWKARTPVFGNVPNNHRENGTLGFSEMLIMQLLSFSLLCWFLPRPYASF